MESPLNDYDKTKIAIAQLKRGLPSYECKISKQKILLGFDGYVDCLYSIVQKRSSSESWIRMRSMEEMSKQLRESAGSSLGMEVVLKKKTSGGFTSNTCKGVSALGVSATLISSWGYPNIISPFDRLSMLSKVKVNSICNPGETVALEFDDGKVMLTDMQNTFRITWELIEDLIGVNRVINLFNEVKAIGIGYWASIPDLNDIWNHLLEDVLPSIDNSRDKKMLIDLADIKKRTSDDISEMLKLLSKLSELIPIVLSLNDQEALEVAQALHLNHKSSLDFIELGKKINNILNLDYLVVHSPHFATITSQKEHIWISQAYTSKPKFTTAAGDHFNSGLIVGIISVLTLSEALLLGNITTSIFIRTGISPTIEDVKLFLNNYERYIQE